MIEGASNANHGSIRKKDDDVEVENNRHGIVYSSRVVRIVLRLLMLLVALQVSGIGSLVVSDCCSTDEDDCSTQTDQKPCNDCPPDCPKCHCNHVVFSVPPARAASNVAVIERSLSTVFTPYEADAPRALAPSSVFRPPRISFST